MKGLISFSLYGDDPRYTKNCIKNKPLADKYYPGWDVRFYYDKTVPEETVDILKDQGCETIDMTESEFHGVIWRCLAVDDENYDAVIVRDADSCLTFREREAVNEWLESEETLHSMTEWLTQSGALRRDYWHVSGYTWEDQDFLSMLCSPGIHAKDVLAHDDWLRHTDKQNTVPFPTSPRPRQHVGYAFLDPSEEIEKDPSE